MLARAVAAGTKPAEIPAIMPQTSLRRPTLIHRLVIAFSLILMRFQPGATSCGGFLGAPDCATLPIKMFKCRNLTWGSTGSIRIDILWAYSPIAK
jgi:hypothetical protein